MRSFFTTRVTKRGGSLYILVPASAVRDIRLKDGDRVHIILETANNEID